MFVCVDVLLVFCTRIYPSFLCPSFVPQAFSTGVESGVDRLFVLLLRVYICLCRRVCVCVPGRTVLFLSECYVLRPKRRKEAPANEGASPKKRKEKCNEQTNGQVQ